MNTTTRRIELQNFLFNAGSDEARQVEWFVHRNRRVVRGSILMGLASLAEARGLSGYFIENDLAVLKQQFYLRSKLVLASVGQSGGASFQLSKDLLFALLSDNSEVISSMANVVTPELDEERQDPRNGRFHVYLMQQAILGHDSVVQKMIEMQAKRGSKQDRESCSKGEDFFSLLLERDEPALKKLIQSKHARIHGADDLMKNFMAYLATLETKLCWYRGIKIQIDHPKVPLELMPIRPLPRYDVSYEFLEPDWVPPKPSLLTQIIQIFGG